ncbi:MAG: hypothetical protein ACLFPL_03995 [Candidatus Nanoarchaeia archaeon]
MGGVVDIWGAVITQHRDVQIRTNMFNPQASNLQIDYNHILLKNKF